MLVQMIASLALCLASQSAFSPDESVDSGRIEVGSRPISEEKKALLETERQFELEAEEKGILIQPAISDDNFSQFVIAAHYSHHQPKYYHKLNAVTNYGDCIEFEDGSNWKIASHDASKILSWRRDDPLVVTPNHSWFSPFNYCITNQATGAFVKANLFLAPISFGPFTHWVVAFDKYSGHLFLEDGSSWKIRPSDWYLFDDWKINDFIILGYNDSWLSSHEYILINVNMNHHIQANPF